MTGIAVAGVETNPGLYDRRRGVIRLR